MAGNTLPNVPPNASSDQQNAVLNQVIDYLNQQQQTQSLYDSTGTKIVAINNGSKGNAGVTIYDSNGIPLALFGKYPDGTIALKIAKTGKDVTTAANSDLIFTSTFGNTLQIVGQGTATVNAIGGQSTYSSPISHNLGYIPIVLSTVAGPPNSLITTGGSAMVPYVFASDNANTKVIARADVISANSLQFSVELGNTPFNNAGIWTFSYFLLGQQAKAS